MKILLATNIRPWGGGENWMLGAGLALRERGHRVWLATPADAVITQRARHEGLPVVEVPYTRDFDPVSWLRLVRVMHREAVEAVVLNMDRVLRLAGLAARFAGVPVVLPRRGSEFPLKDKWVYRFNYRSLATGMIVNSRATARTLTAGLTWRPAGRVHVLHNGVDVDRFARPRPRAEVRAELGLPPAAPVVMVLGELTARKNARLLVEQAPGLLRDFPALRILLVGEGEERENLLGRIAELGLHDHVRLLGFRTDAADLLGAADLLVHPARVEGFGFAVAEALAAGIPAVATDTSSLPEIVDHGETGYLFPVDDGEALAAGVRLYLGDGELRRRHGAEGARRMRERFALDRQSDRLEALLEGELRRAGR